MPRGPGPTAPSDAVPAGAISALLRELVRAPEPPDAGGWERGLCPGTAIGRFELVRELGRGGFGVVFEARDRTLGRAVALKILRPGGGPAACEERLLREAEAAARLAHPNVVTLHDVGRSEHGPHLVLELLRGRTLAARLAEGPLTAREAVRVALEVARGLAHAHAQGVIHRDLTPGNVFLCDDGQVKVLDLGLAHAFGRRKLDGGTPTCMAPEQWRGAPEDERTDVFALGALLFRMLAGAPPFPDDGGRTLRAGRAPPALDVPDVPGLGALVARALAIDPVGRPRDAGEVLAALVPMHDALAASGGAERSARVVRRPGWFRWRRAGAVALALALVGAALAGALALRRRAARAAAAEGGAAVAVLPFADLSEAHDQAYLADGLAEAILDALSGVDGLRVTARSSSFALRGRGDDLPALGAQLGVTAVLEGSVRRAGDRLRIGAHLVRLPDGVRVWSETFDRPVTDLFAVQEEIARAVVEALKVKLLPGATAPARDRRPASAEAYASYLRGRELCRGHTLDAQRRGVEALQRATALDPGYAPAWAALALPLAWIADEERDPAARAAGRQRALAAAERAVSLDPSLADGYSARAALRGDVGSDWRGAQADMEHALALNPSDARTLRRYGLLRATLGDLVDAREPLRRATELDPLNPGGWEMLAMIDGGLRSFAAARADLDRVRALAPDYPWLERCSAMLSLDEGHPAQALAQFEREPDPAERLRGVALAHHALGHAREAQRALEELTARFGAAQPLLVASVHAYRGDADRAFAWIDRAVQRGDPDLAAIRADVVCFARLRGDPRFAELMRRLNLPPAPVRAGAR